MSARGNEEATVPVGRHFVIGAILLVAAAAALLVRPVFATGVPEPEALALAGFTLAFEGLAFWYMPSFAKRTVAPAFVATWAGPVLFPLAFLLAEMGLGGPSRFVIAGALASLSLVLLWRGAPWRAGVPFWRTAGRYQRGDQAAALAFVLGAVVFGLAAILALLDRDITIAWLVGLMLLTLGALDHLLPRNRQAPVSTPLAFAAAIAIAAGAGMLLAGVTLVASVLLGGGTLVALASLTQRRVETKAAGKRLRDARWPLGAAWLVMAFAAAFAGFGWPDEARSLESAFGLAIVGTGLALMGVALLAAPVMFNQVPRSGWVPASAIATALGGLGLVMANLAGFPAWPAALVLGGGLAIAVGVFEPLRTPRRDCEEPS